MVKENILGHNNFKEIATKGNFHVYEHQKDLSITPYAAIEYYYAAKMNVRKRQLLLELDNSSYTVQAGAMQWSSGDVNMSSNVKGAGDFLGKLVSSAVTKESAVKPVYQGTGKLMLEPTYRHIILMDVAEWGSVVLDDGLFLACDSHLKQKIVARSNISSALLGGEGLFNLSLSGDGIVALESHVPYEELIEVQLVNDVMKIDGNMAIAWSGSLDFTVEKSGKSLLGSAVSGEGLVNVYRGTGKILMAPTANNYRANPVASDSNTSESQSKGRVETVSNVFEAVSDVMDLFS